MFLFTTKATKDARSIVFRNVISIYVYSIDMHLYLLTLYYYTIDIDMSICSRKFLTGHTACTLQLCIYITVSPSNNIGIVKMNSYSDYRYTLYCICCSNVRELLDWTRADLSLTARHILYGAPSSSSRAQQEQSTAAAEHTVFVRHDFMTSTD